MNGSGGGPGPIRASASSAAAGSPASISARPRKRCDAEMRGSRRDGLAEFGHRLLEPAGRLQGVGERLVRHAHPGNRRTASLCSSDGGVPVAAIRVGQARSDPGPSSPSASAASPRRIRRAASDDSPSARSAEPSATWREHPRAGAAPTRGTGRRPPRAGRSGGAPCPRPPRARPLWGRTLAATAKKRTASSGRPEAISSRPRSALTQKSSRCEACGRRSSEIAVSLFRRSRARSPAG